MYRLSFIAAMATGLAVLAGCSDEPARGTTPSVSSVPGTPPGGTPPAQRRQIVAGLIADRDNARHTDEELRAGPPDLPPPPRVAVAPRPPAAQVPPAVPQTPVGVATLASPPAPASQVAALPAQPLVAGVRPAAPTGVPVAAAPSDVLSEVYRRALAQSSSAVVPAYAPPALIAAPQVVPVAATVLIPAVQAPPGAPSDLFSQAYRAALTQSTSGVNAPTAGYAMPAPAILPAAAAAPPPSSAVAAMTLGQPTAIRFAANANRLTNEHRAQIAATVEQWKARRGAVRIVSQASDGAASRSSDQMLASFRISSERAEAVAGELRRLGVPPNLISVDSRTGALPGGAPARQVEIFVF